MFKKLWSWFKVHVLRIPAGAWVAEPVEDLPWALPVEQIDITSGNPFTRPFRKADEGELVKEAFALIKGVPHKLSILIEYNEAGEGRLRLVPNGWERGDGDIVIDHRHSPYHRLPGEEPGHLQISGPMLNAMKTGNYPGGQYPNEIEPKELPTAPCTVHPNQR